MAVEDAVRSEIDRLRVGGTPEAEIALALGKALDKGESPAATARHLAEVLSVMRSRSTESGDPLADLESRRDARA